MAQTMRIIHNAVSPSTSYREGADIVAQSQAGNYSVVRVSATAYNTGTTASGYGGTITHTAAIDGIGQTQKSSTLPSGYATNALRWDQSVDLAVGHDAAGYAGNVTLRQTIAGGSHANVQTVAFGGFPHIPKPPTVPGTPVASEVLPTSLRLTWAASSGNGGSAIDGYLVRRWDNPEGTGAFVDSFENNLTRVISGLTPGKQYRFVVYAHNGSAGAYSVGSAAIVVRTLSGMWTKWLGQWKRTVPFVKVAGVWKAVSVFTKDAGVWKRGG